jgi:hypothetical protein
VALVIPAAVQAASMVARRISRLGAYASDELAHLPEAFKPEAIQKVIV